MYFRKVILSGLIVFFSFLLASAQKEESDNRYAGNMNKPEREEWLLDLGFGLFIHISHDSQLGTVVNHTMVGASDDYMDRFINE